MSSKLLSYYFTKTASSYEQPYTTLCDFMVKTASDTNRQEVLLDFLKLAADLTWEQHAKLDELAKRRGSVTNRNLPYNRHLPDSPRASADMPDDMYINRVHKAIANNPDTTSARNVQRVFDNTTADLKAHPVTSEADAYKRFKGMVGDFNSSYPMFDTRDEALLGDMMEGGGYTAKNLQEAKQALPRVKNVANLVNDATWNNRIGAYNDLAEAHQKAMTISSDDALYIKNHPNSARARALTGYLPKANGDLSDDSLKAMDELMGSHGYKRKAVKLDTDYVFSKGDNQRIASQLKNHTYGAMGGDISKLNIKALGDVNHAVSNVNPNTGEQFSDAQVARLNRKYRQRAAERLGLSRRNARAIARAGIQGSPANHLVNYALEGRLPGRIMVNSVSPDKYDTGKITYTQSGVATGADRAARVARMEGVEPGGGLFQLPTTDVTIRPNTVLNNADANSHTLSINTGHGGVDRGTQRQVENSIKSKLGIHPRDAVPAPYQKAMARESAQLAFNGDAKNLIGVDADVSHIGTTAHEFGHLSNPTRYDSVYDNETTYWDNKVHNRPARKRFPIKTPAEVDASVPQWRNLQGRGLAAQMGSTKGLASYTRRAAETPDNLASPFENWVARRGTNAQKRVMNIFTGQNPLPLKGAPQQVKNFLSSEGIKNYLETSRHNTGILLNNWKTVPTPSPIVSMKSKGTALASRLLRTIR